MNIDDRIPAMSDSELHNLHGNAQRLSLSGAVAQKAEAARLLPIINAALEERAAAALTAKAEKREAALSARAARAKSKKAAATAAPPPPADEDASDED